MRRSTLVLLVSIFLRLATHQAAAQNSPLDTLPDGEEVLRAPINPHLFSLSMNSGVLYQTPWPVVSFNSLRLLGCGTAWAQMNPADGQYDFTVLDGFLSQAQANGVSVLLVFQLTPRWASSNPNDTSCGGEPGSCAPPNDLNPDGSGTNRHWKDFVTAVATRSVSFGSGHIRYYELWNEPYNTWSWGGTIQQMVRMASDAYQIIKMIDPKAKVASPSFAWQAKTYEAWMDSYFAAGGGQFADQVHIHGYAFNRGGTTGWPENVLTYSQTLHQALQRDGQSGKPVWNTEANWGSDTPNRHFDDPDLQAAWLARMYLMQPGYGINRFYWFSWNDQGLGSLWKPNPGDPGGPGTLLKPGIAYQQVYNWMVGATMTQACVPNGTVWTCAFTRSNGYVAEAVWDTEQTCSQGHCTTVPYRPDPKYVQYRTLSGGKVASQGSAVPIGAKPILLENQ